MKYSKIAAIITYVYLCAPLGAKYPLQSYPMNHSFYKQIASEKKNELINLDELEQQAAITQTIPTFEHDLSWMHEEYKNPTLNRKLFTNGRISSRDTKPSDIPKSKIPVEEFKKTLLACTTLQQALYKDSKDWQNQKQNNNQIWVQKLEVPTNAHIIFHGDLHGDITSLLSTLKRLETEGYLKPNSYELAQDNFYMIFLGDYVDRGAYGVECMYTVMRLKLANPNRVFLVRGNHETWECIVKDGFAKEINAKYPNTFNFSEGNNPVTDFYPTLPAALFLGCNGNYIQCCHGGLPYVMTDITMAERTALLNNYKLTIKEQDEQTQKPLIEKYNNNIPRQKPTLQYSPTDFLLSEEKTFDAAFSPESKTQKGTNLPGKPLYENNGFMWSDFQENQKIINSSGARGAEAVSATKTLTDEYLATSGLKAVFRAHQHSTDFNNMMIGLLQCRGVYPLWMSEEAYKTLLDSIPDNTKDDCFSFNSGSYTQLMTASTVRTFNVCPDSWVGAALFYDFDTCGILQVSTKYEDWKLQVLWTENQKIKTYLSESKKDDFEIFKDDANYKDSKTLLENVQIALYNILFNPHA